MKSINTLRKEAVSLAVGAGLPVFFNSLLWHVDRLYMSIAAADRRIERLEKKFTDRSEEDKP